MAFLYDSKTNCNLQDEAITTTPNKETLKHRASQFTNHKNTVNVLNLQLEQLYRLYLRIIRKLRLRKQSLKPEA